MWFFKQENAFKEETYVNTWKNSIVSFWMLIYIRKVSVNFVLLLQCFNKNKKKSQSNDSE